MHSLPDAVQPVKIMTVRSLYLALYLCSPTVLAAQTAQERIEVIPKTTVDALGMASTDRLPTPTMFREVHLRIPLPHGGNLNGALLLAHDTASHGFWWLLGNDGDQRPRLTQADWFASHSVAFVAEDKVVVFWEQGPGHLYVVERRGLSAETIDEAQQKAVDELRRHAATIEKGGAGYGLGGTDVPLPRGRVPLEFWMSPLDGNAPLLGRTKVVSAARDGKNWKLVLRDQWDEEVVLDESYNLVSTRRLDSSASPKDK
jgi:hypothetical protein